MNILLWVLFAVIVGWITSLVLGVSSKIRIFSNIGLAICGALAGGLFMRQLSGGSTMEGINIYNLTVASGGALLIVLFFQYTTTKD